MSCLESVGCVTCRMFAAPVILPSRATARKYLNTLSSISVPFLRKYSATMICVSSI